MQKGEILVARVTEVATNIETSNGRRWVMPLRVITTNEIVKVWDNESPDDSSPLEKYGVGDQLTVRRLVTGKNYVEVVTNTELTTTLNTALGLPPVQDRQTLGPSPKTVLLPSQIRQRLSIVLAVYDRVLEHVGAEADANDVIKLVELATQDYFANSLVASAGNSVSYSKSERRDEA